MINALSNKIMSFLIEQNVVLGNAEDEVEFYRYGIEITISSAVSIVLILLIGLLFNCVIESIIFLLCFIPLRQLTGGYHADSYFKCNLTFCVVFFIILNLYLLTWRSVGVTIGAIIAVCCLIIIGIFCPVDNIHKPVNNEQKCKLRFFSLIFSFVIFMLGIWLVAVSIKYGVLVLYTLYLITALIITAKIIERRTSK